MTPVRDDIETLRDRISSGETTARAVVESSVNAAETLNENLNAFLASRSQWCAQLAPKKSTRASGRKMATALQSRRSPEFPLPVKDNICVRGLQTSCGSRILGNYHPPYNATVIERLLARRRGRRRQDQLRRICDGFVKRKLRVWPGQESLGSFARAGRFIGWFSGSGCRRDRARRPWFRHRRLSATTGVTLRRCRA